MAYHLSYGETKQDQIKNPEYNSQILKYPGLEIKLKVGNDSDSTIQSMQPVNRVLSDCLLKIQNMYQEVKQNKKLQKYFKKGGTNQQQMLNGITIVENNLQQIKKILGNNDTNINIIKQICIFLNKILGQHELHLTQQNIDKAIWIIQFSSKIVASMQFIMSSLNIPDDITTLKKQKFQQVWKHIYFKTFDNVHKIKNGLNFTKKIMAITTSACLNQNQCDWKLSKLISFGFSYPQYFFSSKQSQLRSMIFYQKPTIQLAKQIWNLPQNGMTKQFAKLGMKSIGSNVKIYIPTDPNKKPKDISVDDGNSIKVRILYDQNILFKKTKKRSKMLLCSSPSEEHDIETIVLHMHGGGFVALSSRSMQVYTRRWAIELKIPVLSIDYRMPPDHPFPSAPNDCLTVYRFLVKHLHEYVNINPKKIIIAGDSAGGNLAFVLVGMIMKEGLPIPHGLYTAYPACNLQKKFSPSKLFAFTDPLLNPTMLLLCLKQYLQGNKQHETSPLASPVFLTQQYIGGEKGDKRFPLKWPRTIIQVGLQDPLYDDSIRMMQRMVSSNILCQCQVYLNLSHGFLNLEFVIPQMEQTITDSILHIKKLIK